MAIVLEGSCRVSSIREGEPQITSTLKIWPQVGRTVGAKAISLRTLEFAQGLSLGLRNRDCDEVIYVLAGQGTLLIDGHQYAIAPEVGFYIKPQQTFAIANPQTEPLVLISSQCPEPEQVTEFVEAITTPINEPPEHPPLVRLADRKAIPTADRWYRVLVDAEVGSQQVTQFVGSIPPGRAPDHFHHYEEVLFILRGEGRMWAGKTSTPIAAGSCIFLPKRQVHCVENTGAGELRLLGVFYPAGSPAVRYAAE
jgi:mannose-6-phosphate isomerase-like protein (cupin superfamily)